MGRAEYQAPPVPQEPPSAAGTARLADPQVPANEAPTTRFAVAKNAVRNAVNNASAAARSSRPTPPTPDREIESWLGELRGKTPPAPAAPQPSAEPTRAMTPPEDATTAIPRDAEAADDVPASISAEETRAIPISRPDSGDSEVATEQLNARGKKDSEERPRRGGGVSAADLLRREGRL